MDAGTPEQIEVGDRRRRRAGSPCCGGTGRSPGLFWLGGYRSEMTGSKATALDALGASARRLR